MEKLITRTFITTSALVLVCDTEEGTTAKKEVTIPESIPEKKWLSYCSGLLGERFVAVKVLSVQKNETLYGITETDFLKYAKVLPPRGTKTEQ